MKTFTKLLYLTGIAFCLSQSGFSQKLYHSSSLFNVPALAPDSYHAVPLRYMGFKKANYSILVKARLPDDTIFYVIPGVLPTGDSFGFKLKAGNANHSDSLYLIHRGGDQAVKLEEVRVLVFHKSYKFLPFGHDRAFTNKILTDFYNVRTRRGSEGYGNVLPENSITIEGQHDALPFWHL